MNFENRIRSLARRSLPPAIRRPLGNFSGYIRSHLLYPLFGLLFDLSGGRFRADGCSFIIPKNITSLEFRACFWLNTHEEDERRLVQKFILPDDSVLELGACLGILSCITNRRLRNPLRHVVVEANPYCIPAIHQNRQCNQSSFLVEHCAVSTRSEVSFSIHPTHVTGSAIGSGSGTLVRVPGRSLGELVARYGPFSVLVMDVEGSELEILETSRDCVGNFRLILIELHEDVIGAEGLSRCRKMLQEAGFKPADQSFITEVWVKG